MHFNSKSTVETVCKRILRNENNDTDIETNDCISSVLASWISHTDGWYFSTLTWLLLLSSAFFFVISMTCIIMFQWWATVVVRLFFIIFNCFRCKRARDREIERERQRTIIHRTSITNHRMDDIHQLMCAPRVFAQQMPKQVHYSPIVTTIHLIPWPYSIGFYYHVTTSKS